MTDYRTKDAPIPEHRYSESARKVLILGGDGENRASSTNTLPAEGSQLKLKVDEGVTYTYIGNAEPGTEEDAVGWRITRVTNSDGTKLYADSVYVFTKVWDDRASYTYN